MGGKSRDFAQRVQVGGEGARRSWGIEEEASIPLYCGFAWCHSLNLGPLTILMVLTAADRHLSLQYPHQRSAPIRRTPLVLSPWVATCAHYSGVPLYYEASFIKNHSHRHTLSATTNHSFLFLILFRCGCELFYSQYPRR